MSYDLGRGPEKTIHTESQTLRLFKHRSGGDDYEGQRLDRQGLDKYGKSQLGYTMYLSVEGKYLRIMA